MNSTKFMPLLTQVLISLERKTLKSSSLFYKLTNKTAEVMLNKRHIRGKEIL